MKKLLVATVATSLLLAGCGQSETTSDASEQASTATPAPAQAAEATDTESASTQAADDHFPVTIENCGITNTYDQAPERAVVLMQPAIWAMMALDLDDKIVGIAGNWDVPAVTEELNQRYQAFNHIEDSDGYPPLEVLLATEPDFLYASYRSAFSDKSLGSRESLQDRDMLTYINGFSCEEELDQPATLDRIWQQLDDIANIFGVPERAKAIEAEQTKIMEDIKASNPGKGASVIWWDVGVEEPTFGGGTGGPQLIMDTVGLDNVFDDSERDWFKGEWERVLAADPEWFVMVNADWTSAEEKIEYLKNDPALKELRAVKENKFLYIPFGQSLPSLGVIPGAQGLAEQLEATQ